MPWLFFQIISLPNLFGVFASTSTPPHVHLFRLISHPIAVFHSDFHEALVPPLSILLSPLTVLLLFSSLHSASPVRSFLFLFLPFFHSVINMLHLVNEVIESLLTKRRESFWERTNQVPNELISWLGETTCPLGALSHYPHPHTVNSIFWERDRRLFLWQHILLSSICTSIEEVTGRKW